MSDKQKLSELEQSDDFLSRHIGPGESDVAAMLKTVGLPSLDALVDKAVPKAIRSGQPLGLPGPRSERDVLAELRSIASRNRVLRSMIGAGYADCITPPVIQRNVLENPG